MGAACVNCPVLLSFEEYLTYKLDTNQLLHFSCANMNEGKMQPPLDVIKNDLGPSSLQVIRDKQPALMIQPSSWYFHCERVSHSMTPQYR